MYTRTRVHEGDRIANHMIHPRQRRTFEVVAITRTPAGNPATFTLYDEAAGTLGTDPLVHPGWIITPKDAQ